MVIGARGGNMICGFFQEHRGIGSVFGGKRGFWLGFSVAMANSVVVVRQAITEESLGRKQEPHLMIQWIAQLSRAWHIYWDLVS